MDLIQRPRRNRKSETLRNLVAETHLSPSQLVMPFFICEGKNEKQSIATMPEVFRFSVDLLLKEINTIASLGISAIAIFPVIPDNQKDARATEALNAQGL